MIDTVDVFYEFPNRSFYNTCYQSVDSLSRSHGQALHRDGKRLYFTTAFASVGILRIGFQKTKYQYRCHILLQPARCIRAKTNIFLAQASDFGEVCRYMDNFFGLINLHCGNKVLPPLRSWRVKRIDYAVNMETPYAAEYIRLFYAGNLPKGFELPLRHDSSFYLKSESANINFYDKLQQLKDSRNCTDEDIARELHGNPVGLLRLEVQCRNKYIQHLKERYLLLDTTLPYLWDANIAAHELGSKISSVIGEKDFFPYEICEKYLECCYGRRTLSLCCQIVRTFRNRSDLNLHDVKEVMSNASQKQFASLLHKIRKAGINPIPLEAVMMEDEAKRIGCLENPYRQILPAISQSDGQIFA